jgi:hypothetical protein
MTEQLLIDKDSGRQFREAVATALPAALAPDILSHEALSNAGLHAPSTSLLDLTPQESMAVVDRAASILHETWRETRYELATGTFSPRMKATKDETWIAAHGTDQVDIANTSFKDLPKDWQAENRSSAEVALKYLIQVLNDAPSPGRGIDLNDLLQKVHIDAGNKIHEAWIDRNPWASQELKKPFAELPLNEQRKDLFVLNAAVEAYQKALPTVNGVTQHAVIRMVDIAEVIGHRGGAPLKVENGTVLKLSSGIALEIISGEDRDGREAVRNERDSLRRMSCPVPPGIDIRELVRTGAVPTTQEFGDRKQGILLLTASQAASAGETSTLRGIDGLAARPGEPLDLTEIRHHAFSNGRQGVAPYGFDLTDAQLELAKAVHKPAGLERPGIGERLRTFASIASTRALDLVGL